MNVNSLRGDILDYITSTEHCLFNWIANKEVQNFIKAYLEDYEDMSHLSVTSVGVSPLIRISFGQLPPHLKEGASGKVVILSTGTLTSARTESALSAFPLRL